MLMNISYLVPEHFSFAFCFASKDLRRKLIASFYIKIICICLKVTAQERSIKHLLLPLEKKLNLNFSIQSRFGSNHNLNDILGAKMPLLEVQRRDIQSNMTKRFCNVCKARPQCKLHNKCDQCKRWCMDDDFPSNKTQDDSPSSTPETNDIPHAQTPNGVSDASSEESNEVKMTLPNRFGSTSMENQETEDSRLSLPAPGSFRRIFTIANFSSGPLKELICNLLGISDTTDIDKMIIWVTTFSNKPPKFAQGYKKNVAAKVEKLTDSLNEELKRTIEQNRKQGRDYLTNEEMEDMAKKILVDVSGCSFSSKLEMLRLALLATKRHSRDRKIHRKIIA